MYGEDDRGSQEMGPVFSYKLRYSADIGLVDMANPKPAIYGNLHKNTDPDQCLNGGWTNQGAGK